MNSVLLADLTTMIINMKKSRSVSVYMDEVSKFMNRVSVETKKDILRNMIVFCKEYLFFPSYNTKKPYLYGGFVRDWCIPCLNEDFDCMDVCSVDLMFERYPDFKIPCDLDFTKKHGFRKEDISKFFSSISENSTRNRAYSGVYETKTFNVKTYIGSTFSVDISSEPLIKETNIYPNSQDFDVNWWMFRPEHGIYDRYTSSYKSQQKLMKCLRDVKEKRCLFIGSFKYSNHVCDIDIRKRYIDRIKKMLSKGWCITNLSSRFSFIPQDEIHEDHTCMICQEDISNGEFNNKRVIISCCSSIIHINCLLDWTKTCLIKKSFATCPGCRNEFSPVE